MINRDKMLKVKRIRLQQLLIEKIVLHMNTMSGKCAKISCNKAVVIHTWTSQLSAGDRLSQQKILLIYSGHQEQVGGGP